ncbi:hypothetical protein [Capnocytophaga canimorsus]|uniref:hypothetical protein n=1 Tax=Capnocytophaga canimorsus TaxID=28188 RepID=UPI0037D1BA68
MSKIVNLALFLIIGINVALAQKTDVERMKLKGKPKIVKQIDTNRTHYEYHFDTKGIVTQIIYTKEGVTNSKTFNKYKYDTKGNPIKEYVYYKQELRSYFVNVFDEKGNKISTEEYTSDGKLLSTTSYKYDKENNVVEIETTFVKDLPTTKHRLEYNAQNHLSAIYTEQKVEPISTFVYQYDESGNWYQKKEFSYDGELRNTTAQIIEYYD